MKRLLLLAAPALWFCASAGAAPALKFNVSTRIIPNGRSNFAPQAVQASVLVSGQHARIDTSGGGTRAVLLYSPPFVYRLLPSYKAGVKWKVAQTRGPAVGKFDPQQLLSHPSQIRQGLLEGGAKLSGRAKLNGVAVDIYEMTRPIGRFSRVKAWIRHDNALPVRFEAQSSIFKIVAQWSNYTRVQNVAPSSFAPPKGYSIRQSQNPPTLPII